MHIPDGFLDTKTIAATSTLSLIGIGTAWRQTTRHMESTRVPLLGLAAAFVFAAQMLNFPVAGGTSGHLIGAVLASVLLGPSAAVIVITSVLIVQCFLFSDGGVLALGANIFNMAIVGSLFGYWVYRLVFRMIAGERGRLVAVAFASWCSIVLASVCAAGELAWSGTASWQAAFPAMTSVHMVIGLGEAFITAIVVAGISKARPDLLTTVTNSSRTYGDVIVYGSLITLGMVLFISPFASSWPDGLQKVAAALGFDQRVLQDRVATSPIPDYRIPGIGSATLATVIGGVIGVVVVFAFSFLLAKALTRKPKTLAP